MDRKIEAAIRHNSGLSGKPRPWGAWSVRASIPTRWRRRNHLGSERQPDTSSHRWRLAARHGQRSQLSSDLQSEAKGLLVMRCPMRCFMIASAWLLLFSGSTRSGECEVGESRPLQLLEWSAEPQARGPRISFKFKSNLLKAVRSVSASLIFKDRRGHTLSMMPLSPELRFLPGSTKIEEDVILDPSMNDLLNPEKVSAVICTRYVVYSDSSLEDF